MKSHRGYFLQFFLSFWCVFVLFAPESLAAPYRNAVLLTSSEGGCASGVILNDGRILTNAHVTESLCPFNDCKNVTVLYAEKINEQPTKKITCNALTVENIRYSADVSSLYCKGSNEEKIPSLSILSEQGKSTITAVGYPGCGALKESQGLIIQESPFHFAATAKGSFGSSGSGVYDQHDNLVGIIDQAKSLSDLINSLFGVLDFELRGVDARELNALLKKDFTESALESQIQTLLAFYRSNIRVKQGMERLFASFDFTARIDWLAREYLERNDQRGLNLISLGGYFSSFDTRNNPTLAPLIAAYIIESRGFNFAPWSPLSEEAQHLILSRLPEPQKREVQELFSEQKKSPYKGIELTLLQYGVSLLFFAFIGGCIFLIFSQKILRIVRR